MPRGCAEWRRAAD